MRRFVLIPFVVMALVLGLAPLPASAQEESSEGPPPAETEPGSTSEPGSGSEAAPGVAAHDEGLATLQAAADDDPSVDAGFARAPVEPEVWAGVEESGEVPVMIRLREQADLEQVGTQARRAGLQAGQQARAEQDAGTLMDAPAARAAVRDAAHTARVTTVAEALQATAADTQDEVAGLLADLERTSNATEVRQYWVFNGFAATLTEEGLAVVADHPDVATVTMDAEHQLPEPQQADPPRLPEWSVESVNAPQVWEEFGMTGEDVVVGVMDSGVDASHPALEGSYRGRDGDHDTSWLAATDEDYPTPGDGHGHGTHVTGSVTGGAPGRHVGVAPGAEWIAAKVFTDTGGTSDSILTAGFEWMLEPGGDPSAAPHVVNNSWGNADGTNQTFRAAVQAWEAAGIVPVFSNGNEGPGEGTVGSPGSFPESIGVGATDIDDAIAGFSSRGPITIDGEELTKPDISAPGVAVLSAWPEHLEPDGYRAIDGTSMAAPHVSGVIALMLSSNPDASVGHVRAAIERTARTEPHMGDDLPDNTYGHGIADAAAAVTDLRFSGTVTGTVTDTDGDAIEATVTVDDADFSTTADPETGTYQLVLPEGTHTVRASAYGFVAATETVEVAVGGVIELDLTLNDAPEADLSGVVNDSDGNPVSGAKVVVEDTPVASVYTDSDGGFELTVAEGTYTVRASAPGHRDHAEEVTVDGDGEVTFVLSPLAQETEPGWTQFLDNDHRTGFAGGALGPDGLRQEWQTALGGEALFGGAVMADGQVLAVVGDTLHAVDATDGDPVWSTVIGEGSSSVPAVVDGTAYVGGGDTGELHAVNTDDGSIEWTADLAPDRLTYTTPVVGDGVVYVTTGFGAGNGGNVVALGADDGAELWSTHIGGQIFFGPLLADGTLFAASNDDQRLVALNPENGDELWDYTRDDDRSFLAMPTYADGTVYAAASDSNAGQGSVLAIDADNGALLWETDDNGDAQGSAPIIYDDLLIIGSHSRGAVSAYDRADGSVQWRTTPGGATSTSMLTTGDGNVVVGTQDMGGLYVLDAETGEVGWQDPDSAQVVNAPAMADDRLVALDRNGRLTAYVPTGTVEGVVEDPDGPVPGAMISVAGTDDVTETDDDGYYSVETEPGEATVEVRAYGLADAEEMVEVIAGRAVTQSFDLEPVAEGSLQVTVIDEDDTPLSGATVALPDTPLDSGTTDDDGEFTWDEVAEGTHRLTAELTGYGPAETEAEVTAGETAQAELTLAPYDVAVVGDQEWDDADMLTRRLDDAGYLVESVEFEDLVDTPGAFRAIVMNSFEDEVDAETLETFVDAASEAGTSLLWMNTWGSSSGTLKERAELLGDPDPDGFAEGNRDGRVQATILAEHPITDGFQIDEDVDVLSDGSRWSAFDGWPGRTLSSLRTDGTGESGDAIGILASGFDSVEIALSPFAASALTRPDQVWLDGAEQLYLAAVDHAIDAEFGQVTGVVTDTEGGPVQATVTDAGSGEEATADDDGAFELWLPPGDTELHITAAGFQPETQEVTVTAGETSEFVEVELADAGEGTVAGTVTDAASGDAIVGAQVTLEGDAEADTVTGDDGEYEVAVPGGTYEVTFTADDYESVTGLEATVADGETTVLDAELNAQPVVGVLGDLDPDDDGVGMYTEVLRDHEVAATPMEWDDDVTDFEAVALVRPEDPGEDDFIDWLAAADDAGVSTVFLESGFTSSNGGASVQLLRAHLDDPSDHGRVGTGVGATALQATAEGHPLFDGLGDHVEVVIPSERPGYFEGYSGEDIADLVDADGEVIASGAAYQPRPEGNVQLLLSSLGPTLSSSTNPESGWTDDGAVLFANALRWAAEPGLGELEGTVTDTDSEPVADATVTVDPSGTQATTDSDGEYGLALPAGEVTVTAEAFGYEPTSEQAEIASGEITVTDLVLARPDVASISGTVTMTGGDAEPAAGVSVELLGSPLSTETDADGEFTFENVEPGSYELDLTSDAILREQIPIEIEADENAEVTVEVRAAATVGVIADYGDRLADHLQWWGYQPEELEWEDTQAVDDLDLVIGNRAQLTSPDPGLDGWRAMTDAIDRAGVSAVWLGQYNRGTVGLYAEHEGVLEEGQANNAGQVTAVVADPDHPITDGLPGGFELTGEDRHHSWFTDFDGEVAVTVGSDEAEGEPLAGYRGRTAGNVDLLLSTGAFSSYGWHDPDDPGANHYTNGNDQLLRNGLRWALDASGLGADVSGSVLAGGDPSGGGNVVVEETGLSYPVADDGSYLVPLQPGAWTLRAEQPEHESGEIDVTVEAGDSQHQDIELGGATTAGVSGVVTNLDGDPLAGAEVVLEAFDEPVTADDDGQWSFDNVPFGAWLLDVAADGHTTDTQRIEIDGDRTVDVALRPTPDVALAGDTSGALVDWLTDRGWAVESFANGELEPITEAIADYELVILNGIGSPRPSEESFLELQAAAADAGISMIIGGQHGGGAIRDLSETTGDPGNVEWSFTDEAIAMTATHEHPLVAGLELDEATEVLRNPASGSPNQQYLYYEDWSGETVATVGGTVPPEGADEPETFGEAIGYRFSSGDSAEILLGSLGVSSIYGTPERWSADGELLYANALEFAMVANQGTVTGTIEDGNGDAIAGAEVVALGQQTTATTDDDGEYELTLAEGEETLEASALGYEPAEQTITVEAGETEIVDFTLDSVPRGDLEVEVTAGGEPVAGAQVAVVGPVEETLETDDGGTALFEALPADGYDVTVTSAGHLEEVLTVDVEADTTTTLPVELTAYDVAVLVDANGGAMVELLRDADVAATEITWDDTEELSAFEVVIVNGGDPDDEAVLDLLDDTDELGIGLVVTGSWGPDAGGLHLLERVMDDLVVGDTGYDDGPVDLVNVDAEHPVVEGLDDDTQLLAESSPYSVLDEVPGSVLADVRVGGNDEPVAAGTSVAVEERDAGNVHVLLSAGAATDYVGPGYGWTDATEQLLLNAIEFARPEAAELVELEVSPESVELDPGGTGQLTATAIYDDGTESEVTDQVEWVSADTDVVTVDDTGLATAVDEGEADVTATLQGVSATATVTVTEEDDPPSEVVGLEVTPDPLTVEVDGTGALTATATFDDGSEADVTDEAEWVSADEEIATVDAGEVTGVAVGEVAVTASFAGQDDAAEVTVTDEDEVPPPEDLVDLVVSPGEQTVGVGGAVQFAATAVFEDDESVDVTDEAGWVSADEEIATVDAGEVTGVAEGVVEVTAAFGDQSDSATITVDADIEPGLDGLERIAAPPGRVEVAIAASQHRFGDGEASAVVLARADEYPDALAGTTLAAEHDAPLLLTSSDELLDNVADEISRVLGDDGAVYLTGGTVALDDTVEGAVAELGYEVTRLGGETRFETAGLIAEELGERSQVLVTTGLDFPDALTAGAAASANDGVVLLSADDEAHEVVDEYLDGFDGEVTAVGGPATRAYPDAAPVMGATRDETAVAVAEAFFDEPAAFGVARRDDYPDALSGGAHIAAFEGPLLLSYTEDVPEETVEWLQATDATGGFVYGGTAAISDDTFDQIANLAGYSQAP